MSRKTNRKELIAQLVKDPTLMEAFDRIKQSVTQKKISIEEIFGSEDEELSDNEKMSDDSDSDVPELCNHSNCNSDECHKTKKEKKTNGQTMVKASDKAQIRDRFKQLFMALMDGGVNNETNDNSEESADDDEDEVDVSPPMTPDQKSSDNANDLLTEKERKKRKSEKKKLQKKKKKEKRKAEKQLIEINGQNSKTEPKTKNNDKNTSNKSNKQKISENSNTSKSETNTADKQNKDKSGEKSAKQKKESDSGNNSKNNSHESLSAKSSPKSDVEYESWYQSDAEEEELFLHSSYVSQIAQRKNKPSFVSHTPYKSAQTQNHNITKAQEMREDLVSPVSAKRKAFSDNNSVHSNSSDGYRNNYNFALNNNTRSTLPTSNSSRDADDDFPRYKQYFFDNQKLKPTKPPAVSLSKEEITQNREKSVDLAKLANYKAESGQFLEAVELFNQAIELNPKDYRFYVNRSYCFDSIQDFRNALKDAETAIKLKPDWPKCHYRKGKALAGLKNYQESEIALKKVLQLESNCQEALQELKKVRENAIIDMGYDSNTADQYASEYDSISEALKALSLKYEKPKTLVTTNKNPNITRNGNNWWNASPNTANTKNGLKSGHSYDDDDIYISDDEYNCIRPPTLQETEYVDD